ncbi:MAG: hypothetical protein JSV33_01000 [bacterium]|nr:MAG: hypothetical protein JSV33_01000 [bacterium]
MKNKQSRWPRNHLCIACVAIFFILFIHAVCLGKDVVLRLESIQDEYVIREPIKLIATFVNESKEEIRLAGSYYFDMNMKHMFFEVTNPGGETVHRRFQYYSTIGIINDEYRGEPLAPGESREMFLYPNATFVFNVDTSRMSGDCEVTFSEPGEYRVRLVYVVPEVFHHLWKKEGGLYSDPLTIRFRHPTQEEREILDAYWYEGGFQITYGDNNPSCNFNASELVRVIEKYPDNPMIRYANFGLALALLSENTNNSLLEAASVLDMLRSDYPGFRAEEVGQHLGTSFFRMNQKEKAIETFSDILRARPALKDHHLFMVNKIVAEYGKDYVDVWMRNRVDGKEFDIEELKKED